MSDQWEKKVLSESMPADLREKISAKVRPELRRRKEAPGRGRNTAAWFGSPGAIASFSGLAAAAVAAFLLLRQPAPPPASAPEPQLVRHAEMLLDLPVLENWKELKARMEKKKWNRKRTQKSNS